jgi:hypothetical protein
MAKSSGNYSPNKRGLKASNQSKTEKLEVHNATKNIMKGKHASPKIGDALLSAHKH